MKGEGNKKWTPEVKLLVKQLREEGMGAKEIAYRLGKHGIDISANTIHCWVYRNRWGMFK